MKLDYWYLTFGGLLIFAALTESFLKRLPLTVTMFYLGIGVLLSPMVLNVVSIDPILHVALLERATEFAVIVSLFTAGLKLRAPFRHAKWRLPVRLASVSMTVTVGLVTLLGVYGFGLSWGAAVLLGAVLAPTDPVLASEVQLESASDRDNLRFGLTGEAGLNDGTAFPFVMLGLGLLGLHDIGHLGWRWFALDVLWAVLGGLGIGTVLGIFVGRTVVWVRRQHKSAIGREEFLALGLIGLSYGAALITHTYGFLAVFAAGLALRTIERNESDIEQAASQDAEAKTEAERPVTPTGHLTESVLNFNEQLERILEVALVLIIGIMLTPKFLKLHDLWFVPLLLFVIRPIAVVLGLLGRKVSRPQMWLISWFGIRGIGSVYYLTYAISAGLPTAVSQQLISITLWTIAASIVIHGISVTPLMERYRSMRSKRT